MLKQKSKIKTENAINLLVLKNTILQTNEAFPKQDCAQKHHFKDRNTFDYLIYFV